MARFQDFISLRRRWILIALLPVVLVAVGEIAGWPFLRAPAEKLLTRQMDRPVRVAAPFRIRFLGRLRLHAQGLWIAAPAGFDAPHFLDAEDITLKLRYGDLWDFRQSGQLRVATLDVGRLDARLLRNADGDATWRVGKPDPSKPPAQLPVIDLLAVKEGSIHFKDPGLNADLRAQFDTREGGKSDSPISHTRVEGQFRKFPLKAELATTGWLPATTQGAGAPPTGAKGWLTYGGVRADFDGSVQDLFGRRGIHGKVTVQGPSLGLVGQLVGSPLPTTNRFMLTGTVEKQADVWKVVVEEAKIGQSHLAARVTYDAGSKPVRLEGELTGRNLALADLGPSFGTRNEEGEPVAARPGHIFPNRRLDLPSLKNMEAHVTINLDRVDLGNAFKEPIRPFKADLSLQEGKLGLAKVDARTAKGRLSGDISVDSHQKTPQWHSDLAWEGIRLEDWLKSAKPTGKESKPGGDSSPYFTGILQGRAKLAGKGNSTAEVLGSLDGEITTFVRQGTLSHLVVEALGLDVAQGLGLILRGDETLPVQCAVVDLKAENGTIEPKVALIDTPVTMVLANGHINLAQENLDLRLTAKPKNMSPLTVRSPIRIRGALASPEAAPESGPIAARILGGVALAFVNPLAAIIPFIDPGDAAGSPCAKALDSLKRH